VRERAVDGPLYVIGEPFLPQRARERFVTLTLALRGNELLGDRKGSAVNGACSGEQ
jgi:hypothetical protein